MDRHEQTLASIITDPEAARAPTTYTELGASAVQASLFDLPPAPVIDADDQALRRAMSIATHRPEPDGIDTTTRVGNGGYVPDWLRRKWDADAAASTPQQ